jgi:tetratricopeptide (TPR) repeat protein
LNVGQKGFADASVATGLDFAADARAIASTDWDGDGDVDLWITNRTAPSIRFAHNQAGGKSLMLQLQGVTCNRDAIGARVTARLAPSGQRLVQTLRAGDGFLSQSSKWLHFGLPDGEQISELTVAWPGGSKESFSGLERGGRFLLVQDSGKAAAVKPRGQVDLPSDVALPRPPDEAKIFLVSRLPLPHFEYRNFKEETAKFDASPPGKRLIYLWSAAVESSTANLAALAGDAVELRLAGIDVLALSADEPPLGKLLSPDAKAAAEKWNSSFATGMASPEVLDRLDAVQQTLLGLELPLVVPTALLLDKHGRVAAIYRGPVNARRVLADAAVLEGDDYENRARAVGLAGRWRSEPAKINPYALVEKLNGGESDEATAAYVQLLIKQGHEKAAGYELLQPDELYFMAGQLLESRRRLEDAAEAYRVVLQADNQHASARRRLAEVSSELRKYREAADALAPLVEAHPDDLSLRHEWAVRLAAAGDIQQSLAEHREVLRRQPDAIATANNLAWLLATNPDPEIRRSDEAVQIARRVCETTDYTRPETLDTLAAAYAASGRMSGAVTTARRALQLAAEQGQSVEQIETIQRHLKSYEAGQPFFEDPKREYWDEE